MRWSVAVLAMVVGAQGLAGQTSPEAPSDAEIAAIVVAANRTDAELGEWAAARAGSVAVRSFALTMTRDHRAVNEQVAALAQRLGVKPVEDAVSKSLTATLVEARKALSGKQGVEFDRAYMAHEVSYHEAVIKAVDDTLLPSARNAELKAAIASVRPALVAHLEHARHVRAGLK